MGIGVDAFALCHWMLLLVFPCSGVIETLSVLRWLRSVTDAVVDRGELCDRGMAVIFHGDPDERSTTSEIRILLSLRAQY
jgi:hypothetical protein